MCTKIYHKIKCVIRNFSMVIHMHVNNEMGRYLCKFICLWPLLFKHLIKWCFYYVNRFFEVASSTFNDCLSAAKLSNEKVWINLVSLHCKNINCAQILIVIKLCKCCLFRYIIVLGIQSIK